MVLYKPVHHTSLWLNNNMSNSHTTFEFKQYTSKGIEMIPTNIAVESPVSLTVNGKIWLTFQCTPDYLEQMAVGFLFNEGFVRNIEEVASIQVCNKRDNVDVWLNHEAMKPETWRRSTGCHGGKTNIDLDQENIEPILSHSPLHINQILSLISSFLNNQPPHSETGGVHTSAIADGETILFYQEDIGRHNTIDKIAGRLLIERITPVLPIILTTGRVSSDMMQKAIRLRTPYVISMRSTSSDSIHLANEWGITLLSRARKMRVNAFTHIERIIVD
jgi:FdhD protein